MIRINNDSQARNFLRNTEKAWKVLLALQCEHISECEAIRILNLEERGDLFLVQEEAFKQTRTLAPVEQAHSAD